MLGETVIEAIPALSDEPLSMSEAAIVACPAASSCTVMSCATAVGEKVSSIVTTAVSVETAPLTSVIVRVTVLGPKFKAVKLLGLTEIEAMPQLSVEPLSI